MPEAMQLRAPERASKIDDFVAYWARHTPEACACALGDDRVGYAELDSRIERLAKALLAAGIKKGDRVATLSPPSPDFLVAFLATTSIGAIWLGLNPRYQADELTYVLSDSTPRALLTRMEIDGRRLDGLVAELAERVPDMSTIVALDEVRDCGLAIPLAEFLSRGDTVDKTELRRSREPAGGLDPCLIVYTSGSTGRPKGALLHHHGITRFSTQMNALWSMSPAIALNYFPINHVACICDISTPILASGGTIVFMEQFDPEDSLRLMQEERVTFWASVPSAFQMQMALSNFNDFDLSSVQLIAWGGAAASESLIRQLLTVSPNLATNYGMTETMVTAALRPTSDVEILSNCIGPAFPGVEFRLVQADGTEVKPGEPGEIWVRSEYNLAGYWQRPEATDEAITKDGFFKTGDLGILRPDGNYRIVGRIKEMYKSGGYNVYPREVEMVLEDHPSVAMAAVVSKPDPLWQEVGVAYLVADGKIDLDAVADHCRAHLANYKIPKQFIVEASLPLLPVGKVDKVELRRRATVL